VTEPVLNPATEQTVGELPHATTADLNHAFAWADEAFASRKELAPDQRGRFGAVYGFAVETGMHLLRIIISGAFDRFPKLRIVVGHLDEALPFWLFRLDFMHGAMVRANRYTSVKALKKIVSAITSAKMSGLRRAAWPGNRPLCLSGQ
jgi:predicted TIM-barrel fold metal-dependent hydrolase